MRVPTYIIDSFATGPFRGNPAGVCLMDAFPEDELMISVAAELKHSETAFVVMVSEGVYHLRWFTPASEIDLCGHATLASAHVLWSAGLAHVETLRFETRSGSLICQKRGKLIEMDFPSLPPEPCNIAGLDELLGETPKFQGNAGIFLMAELSSEKKVREFKPDFRWISQLPFAGLLITAKSESGADDFVSRLFAPKVGIDEDPVTGSAHCLLAPYWYPKIGKETMVGFQASQRGGFVNVTFQGARTLLSGEAFTVFEGFLHLSSQ